MKPKKKTSKVDSSDPSTWPEELVYGSRRGKSLPAAKKAVKKKKKTASKKKAVTEKMVNGKRMGLCKDKKHFTNVLKEELSLNVAKAGVKVTLKSRLKEDLDIDSLEAIEMLLDLEDKYNVEIDNTLMDFNKIQTVGHLRDFLYDKTLFPEDIAVRDKEAKKKAKELKAARGKNVAKELETVSIFENEYDDYAPPPQIDAEEEMRKIEEEESQGKPTIPLPKGGKQVE